MIKEFDIDLDKKIKKLSKGTIEKLQLTSTLSRNAEIYILDEPIAGVDPAARDEILDLIIEKFNPNSTLIISTHLIADVERILDEIIFIKKGKIVLNDNAEKIRSENNKSVYQLFREMFRS
ncbi:MAG: AAA family ATPase [Acholeplasma sp.]|nr:AAA family ATPase [Acholeplasma sp.]